MNNDSKNLIDIIPMTMQNAHLDFTVHLDGWPATVAIIGVSVVLGGLAYCSLQQSTSVEEFCRTSSCKTVA